MAPTTTDRPRDRRREQTRAEIVAAAWEFSREHGLLSLSLRALAERVGMRAPSLYSYFDSKHAIYDAMFAEGQEEFLAAFADLDTEEADRETLRDAAHRYMRFCTEDPVRFQLLFQRTIPDFEPSAESYALALEALGRAERGLSTAGVTEPRHLDLWTALLTGLTAQQIANDPGGDRWSRLVDEAVDLFCDHAGIPASRPDTDT